MSSSTVTYTSVYTNSKPERVYWGADEELSDGGSQWFIVYGYDGLPMQLIAPPFLNYMPQPKHLPSPDYVPGPEHPLSPVEVPYVKEKGNGDLPVPDLQTMEELCQPSLNGQGGLTATIAIQATNFRLKNDMIQQEDLKGITTGSGTAYQGPTIPTTSSSIPLVVERETKATKDIVHPTNNGSTEDVQPSVVLTESPILNSEPVISPIIEPVASTTKRALIDVFEGKLTLPVGKEAITFLDQTSRYSANYNDMTANRIDVIDMDCEEYSQEVLSFFYVIASGNPTPYYDPIVSTTSLTLTPFGNSDFLLEEGIDPEFCTQKILMEEDVEPPVQHQRRVNPKIHDVIKNEVLKLLDA
nr:reverse transcriptase domain-containing protein [Tanacetum cinerariifolium]